MTDAVFTGAGVVAPTGIGTDIFWQNTLEGTRAISRVERFDPDNYPHQVAGQVTDFDANNRLPSRLLPQTDRMTQMALVAAEEAIERAALDITGMNPFDIGVVTASTAGGFEFGQNELRKLWKDGGDHVSAYQSFAWFYAVNSGQISIRHGCKGPSGVIVADQAGGLDALGQARRQIRRGTPVIVTGGMDATVCPWAWVAQMTTGELSPVEQPDKAYLPFTTTATGWVPGEGGAMLVLEDEDHARNRGSNILGRLSGYAATFDPPAIEDNETNLAAAAVNALNDAGLSADDIGFVVADALGVPSRDAEEVQALKRVFNRKIPVVAAKTGTGRMLSGGAAVDVVVALHALSTGILPPAPGLEPDEKYDIDLVTSQPRETDADHALVLARGAGGYNSCVVLSK